MAYVVLSLIQLVEALNFNQRISKCAEISHNAERAKCGRDEQL